MSRTAATIVVHPDPTDISVRDLSSAGLQPLVDIRLGPDVSLLVRGDKLAALDALHEAITKAYELLAAATPAAVTA